MTTLARTSQITIHIHVIIIILRRSYVTAETHYLLPQNVYTFESVNSVSVNYFIKPDFHRHMGMDEAAYQAYLESVEKNHALGFSV